eukprot:g15495.t1
MEFANWADWGNGANDANWPQAQWQGDWMPPMNGGWQQMPPQHVPPHMAQQFADSAGDWQPSFGVTPPPPAQRSAPFAESGSAPPATAPATLPGVAQSGAQVPPQRFVPGTRKRKLCVHHAAGNCRYGSDCNFAHGIDIWRTNGRSRTCVESVMTPATRALLVEVTGAEIELLKSKRLVEVTGTASQIEKVEKALQRVVAHCNWGANEMKIRRNGCARVGYTEARIRLASMAAGLKDFSRTLTVEKATFSIGTDPSCSLRVKGPLVSRNHAVVEFQPEKGSVYIVDTSTNGAFLNGKRLPPKASAKVMLSHGDELLLQDLEGEESLEPNNT